MSDLSLRVLYRRLAGTRPFWDLPLGWQARILCSNTRLASDDIGRSYAQYRCQWKMMGGLARLGFTLLAYAGLPSLALLIAFDGAIGRRAAAEPVGGDKAIFLGVNQDVIPESLRQRFRIESASPGLAWKGLMPWLKILLPKAVVAPYFVFKSLLRLASYCGILSSSRPAAIICCSEYSFCSSILTSYLEATGRMHINVMHGEKLFNIRDSFFRFSECHIWDSLYETLFLRLKACPGQFLVDPPSKFTALAMHSGMTPSSRPPRLTYYLQKEDPTQLAELRRILEPLDGPYSIRIRLHPIYSNADTIRAIFREDWLEEPCKMPFADSLDQATVVVSKYSTVLFEASWAGKTVVVDNVTDPMLFRYLSKAGYVMLEKAQFMLSAFLESKRDMPAAKV